MKSAIQITCIILLLYQFSKVTIPVQLKKIKSIPVSFNKDQKIDSCAIETAKQLIRCF